MGVECIQGVFFMERAVEELSKLQTTEEYRAFLPFISVSMKYQCAVCKFDCDVLLEIAQHLVDIHIAKNTLPPAPPVGYPYEAPSGGNIRVDQEGKDEFTSETKSALKLEKNDQVDKVSSDIVDNTTDKVIDKRSTSEENTDKDVEPKQKEVSGELIVAPTKKKRVGRPPKKRKIEPEPQAVSEAGVVSKMPVNVEELGRTRTRTRGNVKEETEVPKRRRRADRPKHQLVKTVNKEPDMKEPNLEETDMKVPDKEESDKVEPDKGEPDKLEPDKEEPDKLEPDKEEPDKVEYDHKQFVPEKKTAIIPKKRPIHFEEEDKEEYAETKEGSVVTYFSEDSSEEEWMVRSATDTEDEEEEHAHAVNVKDEDTNGVVVKGGRGRGRPKGSKNRLKQEEYDENGESPPKKKRGRPRIHFDQPERKGLTRHEKEDIKARTCAICMTLIPKLEDVMAHYEEAHSYIPKPFHDILPQPTEQLPDNKDWQPFGKRKKFTSTSEQCQFCGKMFLTTNLEKHVILKHVWKRIQRREQRRKTVLCYICGRVFQHVQNLERHIAEHLGRVKKREKSHQVFQCDVCGYTTPENSRLKKHYMSRHEGVSPYQCSHCEYKTWERSSFKCHMFRHQQDKKYKCVEDNCPYQCIQKKQLRAHMKRHHNKELPKLYGPNMKAPPAPEVPKIMKISEPESTDFQLQFTESKLETYQVPVVHQEVVSTDGQHILSIVEIAEPVQQQYISQHEPPQHMEEMQVHTQVDISDTAGQMIMTPPTALSAPPDPGPITQTLTITHPPQVPSAPPTMMVAMNDGLITHPQQIHSTLQHHQLQQIPIEQQAHVLQPLVPANQTQPVPVSSQPNINMQAPTVVAEAQRSDHNMASLMQFASAAAAVAGLSNVDECTALEQDIARALIQINPMPQHVIQTIPDTVSLQQNNLQQ